jgi:Flagellar biosynthesis protein, FliO
MRKSRRRHRALRVALGLAIILALGFAADAIVLMTTRAHADASAAPGQTAIATQSNSVQASGDRLTAPSRTESAPPGDDPRASRAPLFRRLTKGSRPGGSDPWSLSMIVVTITLVVLGGIVVAGRRYLPQAPGAAMQVVGRVSLSPKHTVYMLRVGRRVLLVGTGPQGSPSLISELDEPGEIESEPAQGEQP